MHCILFLRMIRFVEVYLRLLELSKVQAVTDIGCQHEKVTKEQVIKIFRSIVSPIDAIFLSDCKTNCNLEIGLLVFLFLPGMLHVTMNRTTHIFLKRKISSPLPPVKNLNKNLYSFSLVAIELQT